MSNSMQKSTNSTEKTTENNSSQNSNYIYQIYDKMFKKILTLSSGAVINLINGLFGTDYPKDSIITYNWTEFEDDKLKKILADTILTVNGEHSYHMEAQMTKDEDIVFRVFEYQFGHAMRSRAKDADEYILNFPETRVIYLSEGGKVPDEYKLTLNFRTQGTFEYKVQTVKFQEISAEELNDRKMIILIPFKLLKLRKIMEKERTPENLEKLKKLIQNDIIGSINENLRVGNITLEDAERLRNLTQRLYNHIYSHYDGMEEVTEMTDQSLILEFDILEQKYEEEKQKAVKEAVDAKDKEIALLKERIAQLEGKSD